MFLIVDCYLLAFGSIHTLLMKETVYKVKRPGSWDRLKYFYTLIVISRFSGVYTFINEIDNIKENLPGS